MENKDEPNQDLLPVEIEENQSYLLTYEKNNTKEDLVVLILSFILILAHILNSFFNASINLNHKQAIGILQQQNINNITASYQITNIMSTNLFLTIGFLFSKNNINTESHALVNLTALINASFNSQTVFEKGIHKLNLHFNSRKNSMSSNFYPFFCSNKVNFDSFRLIFAAKGSFDDFSHCLIEIVYSNPIFTYFCTFTFSISIIIIIIIIIVFLYKTNKIKGNHDYRYEFGYVICLLTCSLFYMITNLFIFNEKSIFYNVQFILNSLFISCFFTTIIFFRNLNYPFNTKKDFIISSIIFILYFFIDFFSLFQKISIIPVVSYVLRILLSILSLITTAKYEKASLKEYGNNLLFYSGFILLFGFSLNNEQLILLSQQFYNQMLNKILTSQTIFAYSLTVTYILFPVPLENDHSKDRQPSKKLSSYIEEKDQNDK